MKPTRLSSAAWGNADPRLMQALLGAENPADELDALREVHAALLECFAEGRAEQTQTAWRDYSHPATAKSPELAAFLSAFMKMDATRIRGTASDRGKKGDFYFLEDLAEELGWILDDVRKKCEKHGFPVISREKPGPRVLPPKKK